MIGIWMRNIIYYMRSHIATCFFLIFFLTMGIVCGALAIRTLPETQVAELADYLEVFFVSLKDSGQVAAEEVFGISLFHHMKHIVLLWLLGFTMIGIPAIFFLIFTQGFILGFTVGFLIQEYILRGVLFALIGVLPQQLLLLPAGILIALSAVSLSIRLIRKCTMQSGAGGFREAVRRYGMILVIVSVLTVGGTLVEVYVSPFLLKAIYAMLS